MVVRHAGTIYPSKPLGRFDARTGPARFTANAAADDDSRLTRGSNDVPHALTS